MFLLHSLISPCNESKVFGTGPRPIGHYEAHSVQSNQVYFKMLSART